MQSLKSSHAKKIAEISFADKLKKDNSLEFQKAQQQIKDLEEQL